MPFGDIVHIEFSTTDFEKFKIFYGFFNWTFREWGGDYLLFMCPDDKFGGGIVLTKEPTTIKNFELYVYTPNIDETLPKAQAIGWKLAKEKMPIPEVGFFAVLEDFDGNKISLFENLPDAKM